MLLKFVQFDLLCHDRFSLFNNDFLHEKGLGSICTGFSFSFPGYGVSKYLVADQSTRLDIPQLNAGVVAGCR